MGFPWAAGTENGGHLPWKVARRVPVADRVNDPSSALFPPSTPLQGNLRVLPLCGRSTILQPWFGCEICLNQCMSVGVAGLEPQKEDLWSLGETRGTPGMHEKECFFYADEFCNFFFKCKHPFYGNS